MNKKSTKHSKYGAAEEAGYRRIRLEHILLEELNSLLRDETEDPVLEGVSISSVELSADYKIARAFFVLDAESAPVAQVQDALERSTSFLRSQLADALDTKFVPSLRFIPSLSLPE